MLVVGLSRIGRTVSVSNRRNDGDAGKLHLDRTNGARAATVRPTVDNRRARRPVARRREGREA